MLVICVNITDLIYGLLLLNLIVADLYFGEDYMSLDQQWRSGNVCKLLFVLFFIFNILSPALLMLLTLSRLFVVKFPLYSLQRKTYIFYCLLAGGIFFCSAIAVGLFAFLQVSETEVPFNLCFPFLDPENSLRLVEILTNISSTFQFCVLLIIVSAYCALTKLLRERGKTSSDLFQKSSTHASRALHLKIIIVTVSNIICWIPTDIVFLFALFQEKYSVDLVIWVTAVLSPLNSMINPVVFSFSSW